MSQLINKTCTISSEISILLLLCEAIPGVWGGLTYWKLINHTPKSIQPITQQHQETKRQKEWRRWKKKVQQMPGNGFCLWPRHIQTRRGFQPGSLSQAAQGCGGITTPGNVQNKSGCGTEGLILRVTVLMVGLDDPRSFPTFIILWLCGDLRLFFQFKENIQRQYSLPWSSEERFKTLDKS